MYVYINIVHGGCNDRKRIIDTIIDSIRRYLVIKTKDFDAILISIARMYVSLTICLEICDVIKTYVSIDVCI